MPTRSLILFDSFHDDPHAVREEALDLDFSTTGNFPGMNSPNVQVEENLKYVGQSLRMNVSVNPKSRDITFFRLTRGSDEGAMDIHADPTEWAGVCYLNRPEDCHGGTSFFRHRKTGLTRWPTKEQQRELLESGVIPRRPDVEMDDVHYYFAEEGRNRANWEKRLSIPMAFNRAVFYDAQQFHAISDWSEFGDTPQSARLTQLFFFSEYEPDTQ